MSSYLKIINLDSIDSTNSYAFDLAKRKAKEITMVRAKAQTKGKGRFKSKWNSPKEKGIYVSFIFRPKSNLKDICYLPMIMALAVARVLGKTLKIKIKWPNDVLVRDKKIAGILVEAKGNRDLCEFVIVGIGVNINSQKKDLPAHGTSLYIETGSEKNINSIFNALVKQVLIVYNDFKKGKLDILLKEVATYQGGLTKHKDLKQAIKLC